MKNNIKTTTVLQRSSSGALILLHTFTTIRWMQNRVSKIVNDEKHTLVLNQIKTYEDQYMNRLINATKLTMRICKETYKEDINKLFDQEYMNILNEFYNDITTKDIHFEDYTHEEFYKILASLNEINQSYPLDLIDRNACEKIYDEEYNTELFILEDFINNIIDNNNFIIEHMTECLKEDIL